MSWNSRRVPRTAQQDRWRRWRRSGTLIAARHCGALRRGSAQHPPLTAPAARRSPVALQTPPLCTMLRSAHRAHIHVPSTPLHQRKGLVVVYCKERFNLCSKRDAAGGGHVQHVAALPIVSRECSGVANERYANLYIGCDGQALYNNTAPSAAPPCIATVLADERGNSDHNMTVRPPSVRTRAPARRACRCVGGVRRTAAAVAVVRACYCIGYRGARFLQSTPLSALQRTCSPSTLTAKAIGTIFFRELVGQRRPLRDNGGGRLQ